MKKFFAVIFVLILTGCGASKPEGPPDFDINSDITGEITISCYNDRSFLLDKAILAFVERYPNVTVSVEKFEPEIEVKDRELEDGTIEKYSETMDDDQAESDYIQRLNTHIMAGSGADILQIDIIPWYRYADGGYLEDLNAYMEDDPNFNKADYRANVFDAVKYKGGQYIFPLSFFYNFIAYDTTLLNDSEREALSAKNAFSISELVDIAKDAFKGDDHIFGYTGGYEESSIFHPLLAENYASFVDIENRKAVFDDGRFEELLLTVTEYVEKGYVMKTLESERGWGNYGGLGNPNPNQRFCYKQEDCRALMQNIDKDMEISQYEFYTPGFGYDEDDAIAGMAADYKGDIPCRMVYVYAINSNSKNKRAAWEFIKFMAGEEVQGYFEIIGVPVNKNAFVDKERRDLKQYEEEPLILSKSGQEIFKKYLAQANEFADMANTFIIRDNRIDEFIEQEAAAYFAGTKSAKDAAAALQNKVKLYLSEQG